MTSPAFRRSLWGVLVAAVLTAGYLQIFSIFALYDDEGYVLFSLQNFTQQGALYDRVYSQYGPLFYLIFGGLARVLDLTWSHDLGRFFTLFNWVGTAGICGWIALRLSQSQVVAAITFVGTFTHLWQMALEPMHPGGILALLIAAGTAICLEAILRDRPEAFTLGIALVATTTGLIKINVGLFFALAGFMWLWLNRRDYLKYSGVMNSGMIILAALGPAVLMAGSLPESWAALYALTGGVAIASIGVITMQFRQSDTTLRIIGVAILTSCSLFGVTLVATLLSGSSVAGIIQGVLLGPLGHSNAYHFGFNWRSGTLAATLLSSLVFLLHQRFRTRDVSAHTWITTIGIMRILVGAAVIILGFSVPNRSVGFVMTSLGASLWWLCIPLDLKPTPAARARVWLGLVLAWQYLHAYPVAGSQIGWGTFLWIPLTAVAIHEFLQIQFRRFSAKLKTMGRLSVSAVIGCIVFTQVQQGTVYFEHSEPSGLKGASHLRLPAQLGSAARIMTLNARWQNEVLFSFPGAYSFNLWSELPAPNEMNATHWFSLLDHANQEQIAARLDDSRAPLIVQPGIVAEFASNHPIPPGPLLDYIESHYVPAAQIGPLAYWRHPEDHKVLINVAEILELNGTTDPNLPSHLVSVRLNLATEEKIAAVTTTVFAGDTTIRHPSWTWHRENTQVEVLPIFPDGSPRNQTSFTASPWPISASGLNQINFFLQGDLPAASEIQWWLKFINPNGDVISEARFSVPIMPSPSPRN